MNPYEKIEDKIHSQGLDLIHTDQLPERLKAITYCDDSLNLIAVSNNIPSIHEKTCILAEELGHYQTSYGNLISDSNYTSILKQEEMARRWADDHLLSPKAIADAIKEGCMSEDELVELFCITHEYLHEAIDRYICRYGIYFEIDETTMLCFCPLGLLTIF